MKKIIIVIVFLALAFPYHKIGGDVIGRTGYSRCSDDKISADCTYKGFKLYGKVKIVTSFPDVKVQLVDAFPDLKVKLVDAFPDDCGEWQLVDAFPDVKVQFVTAFPDIKIKYVDAFPGKP